MIAVFFYIFDYRDRRQMASSVMVIRLARLGFVHNEKSLDVGLIIGLFKGDCCLCVGGPLDEKLDCSVADLLELTLDLCFEGNRPPPSQQVQCGSAFVCGSMECAVEEVDLVHRECRRMQFNISLFGPPTPNIYAS